MGRRAEPRYWPSRDAWYVEVGGIQHRLARGKGGKAEAWANFHKLMASGAIDVPGEKPDLSVEALCDLMLKANCERIAPLTLEFYRRHLQSFIKSYGKSKARDIRPYHIDRWLAQHDWARSTRHGAITAVKRVFNWATRQGYLESNPVLPVERPGIDSRAQIMTGNQEDRIFDAVRDPEFRNLLVLLRETGMRPSEAMRLDASMIDRDQGLITMASKTTRRTRRPRIIPLTDRAAALLAELAALCPEGPLLRNLRGNPWTRHAIAHRFGRLREKLGLGSEATAESYRHGFATEALLQGIPPALVAEIMGHRGTKMLELHYGHLHERPDHLKEAMKKIRPGDDGSG